MNLQRTTLISILLAGYFGSAVLDFTFMLPFFSVWNGIMFEYLGNLVFQLFILYSLPFFLRDAFLMHGLAKAFADSPLVVPLAYFCVIAFDVESSLLVHKALKRLGVFRFVAAAHVHD